MKKEPAPPGQMKVTRVTSTGRVKGAAISRDGKYVVYALAERDGQSLWLKHVYTGSTTRILQPEDVVYWGLTISPDSSYVYCSTFAENRGNPLFRIPILGGAKGYLAIKTNVSVSFSPDGRRIAYTVSEGSASHLMIADADGSNESVLATSTKPEHFWSSSAYSPVAWSPDGDQIACSLNGVDEHGTYMTISGVSVKDGSRRLLTNRRWDDAWYLNWLADSRSLVFIAREQPWGSQHIWILSLESGEARRITDDLNEYEWLGTTADGQTLMAVHRTNTSHIRIISPEGESASPQPLHTESESISNVCWLAGGRILYSSKVSGKSELWTMNPDGTNPTQLTVGARVERGVTVAPDGRYIAFSSTRGGNVSIWRVDVDGTNFKQLTEADVESLPSITADGEWVIYQRGGYGVAQPSIWKVPVQGGEPIQINSDTTKAPITSPDGERVAFYYLDQTSGEDVWRVGIISAEDGSLIKSASFPKFIAGRVMRWTPDGRGLTHVHYTGETSRLIAYPLDGGEGKELKSFGRGNIDSFAWSSDGKRVVIAQSVESDDVVLIRDFQ